MSRVESAARRRLEALEGQLTLEELEELLSLEEIMHFRMSAAMQHSKLFLSVRNSAAAATASHTFNSGLLDTSSGALHRWGSFRRSLSSSWGFSSTSNAVNSLTRNAVPGASAASIDAPLEASSTALSYTARARRVLSGGIEGGARRSDACGDVEEEVSAQELFKTHIMTFLHVLGTGTQTPLSPNVEAIIRGQRVRPSLDATFC